LPLIPALNLKAPLGQKPQNQPSSSLIILKKSPVIIVTGNINGPNPTHPNRGIHRPTQARRLCPSQRVQKQRAFGLIPKPL
jgi:hypothetical protein